MRIVLATNNKNKKEEYLQLSRVLKAALRFATLDDYNIRSDPSENGSSYLENALIKARAAAQLISEPVLADDTGIEIEKLGWGRPGIQSHRYLDSINFDLTKLALETLGSRACFHCTIVYIPAGDEPIVATGSLKGSIVLPRGKNGFGYDAIFKPDGSDKTLAEMTAAEKNKVSHRRQALENLLSKLIPGTRLKM